MTLPKYTPNQWVMYKMGSGTKFGVIKGGYFDATRGWRYAIEDSMSDRPYYINQADISASVKDGQWVAQA
jgi:hypothetical protein